MQSQLLSCVNALLVVSAGDCVEIGLQLFTILITVLSQHRSDTTRDNVSDIFNHISISILTIS